jgi:small subunit ribosomal protein S18
MNYFNKNNTKKGNFNSKRNNWNQSLRLPKTSPEPTKIRKSLQYLLILKKFDNVIDYKNVKLLSAFLNKYGKIKPRRKTRLSIQQQRAVAKAIRKARDLKLIPFVYDVKS